MKKISLVPCQVYPFVVYAGVRDGIYLGEKTVCQIGGGVATQDLERVYETDQIIEYTWDITTLEVGIFQYFNRHIGIQLGYEYSQRDGDVLIRHPETASDPRTEYRTETDFHALRLGVIGRF